MSEKIRLIDTKGPPPYKVKLGDKFRVVTATDRYKGRVFVAVEPHKGHPCHSCVASVSRMPGQPPANCGDMPICNRMMFIDDTPEAWETYLKEKLSQ